MTFAVDANILVYAIDLSNEEKFFDANAAIAATSVAQGVLPMQALGEFANVCRRRRIATELIKVFVDGFRARARVVSVEPSDLDDALWAVEHHKLSFWDAMLWATCRRAGCTVLFTEDFQDGRTLKGVRFVDPFLSKNAKYLPKV
jgi:predicted nucleic acid-binding protein